MDKRKVLKIGLLVILFLLCFFCIFNICETIYRICEHYNLMTQTQNSSAFTDSDIMFIEMCNSIIKSNFKELFFPIVLLCLSIACIVYLIKGSNYLNKAKLTYEEYKELSRKKKAEKQAKNKAKKKEKLENKLKRLE